MLGCKCSFCRRGDFMVHGHGKRNYRWAHRDAGDTDPLHVAKDWYLGGTRIVGQFAVGRYTEAQARRYVVTGYRP